MPNAAARRREIESLLAAGERANSDEEFLGQPAWETMAQAMKEEQLAMIGSTVSHYRIISLLGRGGMGQVYLAQDERLGRNVALKFLPAEFTQDQERVRRFKQEARAASALNHPNIITIFEIDEAGGAYSIATEFIDGQTLRQCLAEGTMSLEQTLDVAVQIASALCEAHGAGIVHRDIKPENIMLRHDGYVKVLDFGLAKLSEPVRASDSLRQFLTDPGKVMGTPRYMSPEQIRGMQVDARSDIFSLGVVLYEMIAGHAPFEGASAGETIAAILEREPTPLNVPPELAQVVNKALAKDRDARWPRIGEMWAALKQLKLDLEFSARLKREDEQQSTLVLGVKPSSPVVHSLSDQIEPAGGAVPLASKFYIVRPADEKFRAAIARRDSIVLLKGARQVGKTSLLVRGILDGRPCPSQESFYRLRSAGLILGDSPQEAAPRCQLYANYLRKRL